MMLKTLISTTLLTNLLFADVSFNGNKTSVLSREEMAEKLTNNEKRIQELETQLLNLSNTISTLTQKKVISKKIAAEPKKPAQVSETSQPSCEGIFHSNDCKVAFEKVN